MFAKYAQYYIDRGLSVFPARANKKPAVRMWAPYQTRLPSTEEIKAWSRDRGDLNIAVVTGRLSNLTIVDCDSKESVDKFEAVLPEQYEVPSSDTPKGGRHFYFQFAPEFATITNSQAKIDIRNEGGYGLLPPSRTRATPDKSCVDGKYRQHNETDIMNRQPMPDEVRAFLRALQTSPAPRLPDKAILKQGSRDQDLFHAALQLLKDGRPRDEVERIILAMAKSCEPPFPEKEALAKVRSAWKTYNGKAAIGLINDDEETVLDCQPLSAFRCREVTYVMEDRIPNGVPTLIGGSGGVGKSTLLAEIASRVSRGEPIAGATRALASGSTIYITTENQPEEIFKPRIIACKGNLDKIFYTRNALVRIDGKPDQPMVFDCTRHLPGLRKKIKEIGDVRLVVIDPIISHINERIDPNSSIHVRHVMDALSDLARETEVALVIIVHMSKGLVQQAMYKVAGSHQWVDAARVVHAISLEKENHDRRLLSPMKANVYISPLTLAFEIIVTYVQSDDLPGISIRTARVEFEAQELEIDVEAQFNPVPTVANKTAQATLILQEQLRAGPRSEAEIRKIMEDMGIGDGSYYNARKKLRIHAEKMSQEGGWRLWLPDHWDALNDATRSKG